MNCNLFHDNDLKLRQFRHTGLFYKLAKLSLLVENFRIKKQSAKVKVSNLNKHSTICYRNCKGTTIRIDIGVGTKK
jgi:hypothetical protein